MKLCSGVLVLIVLGAAPLRAQELPPDSLFDRLIGGGSLPAPSPASTPPMT